METKIEVIVPERARRDLQNSDGKNFRKRNDGHIVRLSRAMRDKQWKLNGESIKYDRDGILKDGQHRFLACISANESFKTLVVYGIEDELNLDCGKKRSISDWLAHNGEKDCTILAAALRLQWRYDNDVLASFRNAGNHAPSNSDILQTLDEHPEIRNSTKQATRYKYYLPPSTMAFVHYNAWETHNKLADAFIDDLVKQVNLEENDPAFVLHKRLVENRRNIKSTMKPKVLLAAAIKAWNAYLEGRAITAHGIRWTEAGRGKEPFPDFYKPDGNELDDIDDRLTV